MNYMPPNNPPPGKRLSVVAPDVHGPKRALFNIEAEQSLLGALMVDPSTIGGVGQLGPQHFYDELHGRIFELIREKVLAHQRPTSFTLKTAFPPDFEVKPGVNIGQYLFGLGRNAPTTISVPDYARTIINCDMARDVASTFAGVTKSLSEASIDATPSIVAEAAEALRTISKAATMPDASAFEMFDDISLNDDEEDLVDGILPAKGLGALYGPSGGGKTFTIIDIGMSVARGTRFAGRHETQRGGVVYVPLEGKDGARKRLVAYRDHYGVKGADFAILDYKLDLCDPSSVAGFLLKLDEWKRLKGSYPAMVIADTLNLAMPGRKENASEDMGAAIAGMATIKTHIGGLVLAVHHTGKDEAKGARGHSSFYGALDVALMLKGDKDGPTELAIDKMREGESNLTIGSFTLESKVVGQTRKGKPKTSAIVRWSDQLAFTKPKPAEKLPSPQQMALLNQIDQLVLNHQCKTFQNTDGMPDGLPVVTFDDLVERAIKAGIVASTDDRPRVVKTIREQLTRLTTSGHIGMFDKRVWKINMFRK